MAKIDNGISCYTCKYFEWVHYTSKFIDFCKFYEESLPTQNIENETTKSGERLLICKHFELHEKFNNSNYSNLISQYGTFQDVKQNLKEKILYSYLMGSFSLSIFHEFEKE